MCLVFTSAIVVGVVSIAFYFVGFKITLHNVTLFAESIIFPNFIIITNTVVIFVCLDCIIVFVL